ncbi:MAG: hypothetical protein LBT46_05410 [Planctomycetaceae bacterium]|jgi:hypothetical protein|nr:hypothetical protein [Planctomycetaceae bacterium]
MKRILSCIVLFVSFVLLPCCNVRASDESVAILAKAFEHSGYNPGVFHSGKAEFNVTSAVSVSGDTAPKQGVKEESYRNIKIRGLTSLRVIFS